MNIKTKMKEWLSGLADWIEYLLRRLYGKPTLMKQFMTVLVTGSLLGIFSIYILVASIYNTGKNDARKEFLELQHIRGLELQKNDSIESITN